MMFLGSASHGNSPCSSLPLSGPLMFPVQEDSVPVPVPGMGLGSSYRVNSAPISYDSGHKISRLDSSCLGSPGAMSRDQAFRDQVWEEYSIQFVLLVLVEGNWHLVGQLVTYRWRVACLHSCLQAKSCVDH